jgi:hypothetical protein
MLGAAAAITYAPGAKKCSYTTDYYTRTISCRYHKAHITVEIVRPIDG